MEPTHIYYDLKAVHQNSDNTQQALTFKETRTVPYLMTPQQYFLSIVRFNMSSKLPVFIPRIQVSPSQTDPNKTIYTMYINIASITVKINFKWISPTLESPPPPDQNGFYSTQDINNEYYKCFNYKYFLNLMNKQISDALALAFPGGGANPIWFQLDDSTYKFKLNYGLGPNIPRFFMNAPLKNLFSAFSFQEVSAIPNITIQPPPLFELLMEYVALPGALIFTAVADYPTLSSWNPTSSIVFTTSLMPIEQSQVSKARVYGQNTTFASPTSSNVTSSTVTDFTVNVGPNNFYVPEVDYLPSGEYRLIDMVGNSPIYATDIKVEWMDKYGNLYPFYLPSGGWADIKILFRQKRFNITSKTAIV